jgi:hypothetical protein
MRAAVKAGVVLLPFVLVFLGLRACAGGEAERWRKRAAEFEPDVRIIVDEDDLIVIGHDREVTRAAVAELRSFRRKLDAYGDILGRPFAQRMVVVLFAKAESVRAYAGKDLRQDPQVAQGLYGYTDPVHGAMFLPAEADFSTLHHETVHWVMETTHGGQVRHSPWLLEGLAQLFERLPPGVGEENRRLMLMLRPDATLDVDRLLSLQDYTRFVTEDGHRNYLDALLLTAFLFEKRDPALLARYVEEERAVPDDRPELFRSIYHEDEEPFRRDLREFLRGLR